MATKKEDFMDSWRTTITKLMPDLDEESIVKYGEQLWMGRTINYSVVDDDNFNVLAHRYYHGIGSIRLQLLIMAAMAMPEAPLPLLVAEQMFSLGFMCGTAHERGVVDVDDVAPAEPAAECLAGRPSILKTREELDQEDALPNPPTESGDLPEGFGGLRPPPPTPPQDIEGKGYY